MGRRLGGVIAAATGLLALAGGTTAALAATSSPTPTPSSTAKVHHHRGILRHGAVGEVTSLATSGGVLGAGQIVIKQPDGNSLTFNLTSKTRVMDYQGRGVKPTQETIADISQGELVAVRQRDVAGTDFARLVLNLGFQASS